MSLYTPNDLLCIRKTSCVIVYSMNGITLIMYYNKVITNVYQIRGRHEKEKESQ